MDSKNSSPMPRASFTEIPNVITYETPDLLMKEPKAGNWRSPGVIVAHESPKRARKRSSSPSVRKISNRPSSARPSRGEASALAQVTSHSIVNSIYSFLSNKHPGAPKSLSSKDHKEIELYLQSKNNEFYQVLRRKNASSRVTPYHCAVKERAKSVNRDKEKRLLRIVAHKHREELERKKRANQLTRQNRESALQKEIAEHKIKLHREMEREEIGKRKEERKLIENGKADILANINNFYQNQLGELREKLDNQNQERKTLDLEKKKIDSDARKQWNSKRAQELREAQNFYDHHSQNSQFILQDNAKKIKIKMTERQKKLK